MQPTRPFRLLSEDYAKRFGRLDKQFGGSNRQPGSMATECRRFPDTAPFNKGKNIAQLKIAKAQEEAVLAFRQKLLDAGSEVNNALVQWQTARKCQEIDKQRIKSLESTVRSPTIDASRQYQLPGVLTAQQTLLQAELTEVSDKYDEIQGVINLYHALGGGAD